MAQELNYTEAVSVLTHALKFGINPSLEPIQKMCHALGDPQESYKCVQVAGSNGKSSTTRMVAALLREHGYKVGLYTSPHLVKYPERIELDGKVIDDRDFAAAITAAVDAAEKIDYDATEFELLTAGALWFFEQAECDWVVLECGLGGRWDGTSVVTPKVAVITGVALEHTAVLGDTVEAIAGEKGAIIKPGSKAVLAHDVAAFEVFEARAKEVGAPLTVADPFSIEDYLDSLAHLPSYQRMNAATSLAVIEAALEKRPDPDAVRRAFAGVVVPGRFEVLRAEPLLMVDAAHNPQSAEVLAVEISRRFVVATATEAIAEAGRKAGLPPVPTLLLGVLADKDARGVIRALCPLFNRVVATASSSPRSISAAQLARIVEEETGRAPEVRDTIAEALDLLRDTPTLATGSITVAGEVKRLWC